MRRRRGGDARDHAEARAAEIRHAGGAVVDDGQPAARKVKSRKAARQVWVEANTSTCAAAAHFVEPGPPRRHRRVRPAQSASRRATAASPCTMPMRKAPTCATRCIGRRAQPRRAPLAGAAGAQQRQDLVGARDHVVGGHALRIGAAAAGADIRRRAQFSVSTLPRSARCGATPRSIGREPIGLGVEPVEIAVEHRCHRRAALAPPASRPPPARRDCRKARRPHKACRRRNPARARTRAANNDSRSGQTRPAAPSAGTSRRCASEAFIPPPLSARRRSSSPARRCSRSSGRRRGSDCRRCRRRCRSARCTRARLPRVSGRPSIWLKSQS